MRVKLQDIVFKIPPSDKMNNECAPSVPLPTVPTCKWDLLLQLKVADRMSPSYILREHPWVDGGNVIHRKGRRKRMGILPHTRTDNTSLHWETAEPLLTPLRSCYTLQQPQMAGSHVLAGSVGTNQQPLGASRHFQFFTEFCKSACFLAHIKDPQQVRYDKGREML